MRNLAVNHPFVHGGKCITLASADVFLRINRRCLQRTPMRISVEVLQMFEPSMVENTRLNPWLRGFTTAERE